MADYKPYVCMQTNSSCYRGTSTMKIVGVLWHSTGANNPNISRYVQPSDNSSTYNKDIKKIGKNIYKNDWNHIDVDAGLNAWIGKLADGTVGTVQTMPWNFRPWGCGSGSKGSCNNGWIQFEICEDALKDKKYAEAVYKEAVNLTAYLCKMYNINPKGYVTINGTKIPTITCHGDAGKLGFASDHVDINHWFPSLLKKDMSNVRNEVSKLVKGKIETAEVQPATTEPEFNILKKGSQGNDVVTLQKNLNKVLGTKLAEDGDFGDKTFAAVKTFQNKAGLDVDGVYGPATDKALQKAVKNAKPATTEKKKEETKTTKVKEYKVKVTADALNIRKGAGTKYGVVGVIYKNEVYTIVEEKDGWGKLKSGAGWIMLKYTSKK